ncbi:MAG TPA: hypothetical protein VGH23_20535 [Rhizomicrobium sp.]|jgi:hypothetical protein
MVTKFEAKKHSYRQTKEGVVVSFVMHPNDVDAALAAAPLGTVYAIGILEVPAGISPAEDALENSEDNDQGDGNVVSLTQPETKAAPTGQGWDALPYMQQAGIRCNDPQFQGWLAVADAEKAADAVRIFCKVESRRHIVRGTSAGERWAHMDRDFRAFLTSQQYAGSRR